MTDVSTAVAVRPAPVDRTTAVQPWHDDAAEAPAVATGRALLGCVWQNLRDGAIECIDVYFRSGHVVTDLIALRLRGPIAEASQVRGSWTHVLALDDIAVVRGVAFGRMR